MIPCPLDDPNCMKFDGYFTGHYSRNNTHRITNALANAGYQSMSDLASASRGDILDIQGLSVIAWDRIELALRLWRNDNPHQPVPTVPFSCPTGAGPACVKFHPHLDRHDNLGHRVAFALARAGHDDFSTVALLTTRDILDIRSLGKSAVEYLTAAIDRFTREQVTREYLESLSTAQVVKALAREVGYWEVRERSGNLSQDDSARRDAFWKLMESVIRV